MMETHEQLMQKLAREDEILAKDETNAKSQIFGKREEEELKKLDKLIKRERNDFENIAGTGANVKQVVTKVEKTITTVKSTIAKLADARKQFNWNQAVVLEKKEMIEKALKKKDF